MTGIYKLLAAVGLQSYSKSLLANVAPLGSEAIASLFLGGSGHDVTY